MSVAIIPMAQDFGWSPTTSGLVQSAFFAGYALTQVPGGYQAAKRGGAAVLPVRKEYMGGPVRVDWLRGGSSSENGVTGGTGTALRAVESGGGAG